MKIMIFFDKETNNFSLLEELSPLKIIFNCGKIEKKNRNKSQYKCSCGYVIHADINAAKNIQNNYLLSLAEKNNEQAACKSAECLGQSETKPTTLVVG
jgi:hypothetical protein